MGVVYKITPEIMDLIVEEKRKNPTISCRKLARIIEEKFDIQISKSSINTLTKGAGLSMPVGRRSKGAKKEIKISPEPEPLLPAPEEKPLLEKEESQLSQEIKPPLEIKEEPAPTIESKEEITEKPPEVLPQEPVVLGESKEAVPEKEEVAEQAKQEEAEEKPIKEEPEVIPEIQETTVGKEEISEQKKEEPKEEIISTPETEAEKENVGQIEEIAAKEETVGSEEPVVSSPEAEIESEPKTEPIQEPVSAEKPVEQEQKEQIQPKEEQKEAESSATAGSIPVEPTESLPPEEVTPPPEPEKPQIPEPVKAEEIKEPLPPAQEEVLPEHLESQEQPVAEEKQAFEAEEISPAKAATPIEINNAGLVFLKAADNLMGVTRSITELLRDSGLSLASDTQEKIEFILYKQISGFSGFSEEAIDKFISAFSGKDQIHEALADNLFLKQIGSLTPDILRLVSSLFREIRCVKLGLSDGNFIYLDPQMRSIWPSPYIPYGFSVGLAGAKRSFSDCFVEENPVVLFLAPYNDVPIDEMFTLFSALSARGNKIINFGLYNEALEEVETVHLARTSERDFIVGLFPRQFGEYVKVAISNDSADFIFEPLDKKFQVCDGQAELVNPNTASRVSYRVCAVKNIDTGKVEFMLLTNIRPAKKNPGQILASYLSVCPDFAAAFSDMKAKINLFSIMAENYQPFSLDILNEAKKDSGIIQDISKVFVLYLNSLQAYAKRYFFPVGYENKDFEFMYNSFYSLKAQISEVDGSVAVKFLVPQGYVYLSVLRYVCSRVNENRIILKGKKLFLTV